MEVVGIGKYFDHAVDFLRRVVEVKAGAAGAWETELAHERLVAVVTASQRESFLIAIGR